mgnify:CR=1 FL=1
MLGWQPCETRADKLAEFTFYRSQQQVGQPGGQAQFARGDMRRACPEQVAGDKRRQKDRVGQRQGELRQGKIGEGAAQALGRPYSVRGTVVLGRP